MTIGAVTRKPLPVDFSLKSALDSLTGFGRHGLLCVMVMLAALGGGSQKFELLSVTRTPATHREMNPQSDSLHPRERAVERFRLQADGLFAIRRERTEGSSEPIHD